MDGLKLFIAEGLLGYLLQCVGCILGICAVAKKRVKWLPLLGTSAFFAVIVYLVRTLGRFNFGVHTMLIILIENLICLLIFKVDVRYTILGSLMVTTIVLAGEMINYSLLMIFFDQAQIAVNMTQPLFKALAAVPGNLILGMAVTIAYILRVIKGKKENGKAG